VTVSNGVLPDATQDFSIRVQSPSVAAGGVSSGGGGGALNGLSLLMLLLAIAAIRLWRNLENKHEAL
jgi:hypothetical protein